MCGRVSLPASSNSESHPNHNSTHCLQVFPHESCTRRFCVFGCAQERLHRFQENSFPGTEHFIELGPERAETHLYLQEQYLCLFLEKSISSNASRAEAQHLTDAAWVSVVSKPRALLSNQRTVSYSASQWQVVTFLFEALHYQHRMKPRLKVTIEHLRCDVALGTCFVSFFELLVMHRSIFLIIMFLFSNMPFDSLFFCTRNLLLSWPWALCLVLDHRFAVQNGVLSKPTSASIQC